MSTPANEAATGIDHCRPLRPDRLADVRRMDPASVRLTPIAGETGPLPGHCHRGGRFSRRATGPSRRWWPPAGEALLWPTRIRVPLPPFTRHWSTPAVAGAIENRFPRRAPVTIPARCASCAPLPSPRRAGTHSSTHGPTAPASSSIKASLPRYQAVLVASQPVPSTRTKDTLDNGSRRTGHPAGYRTSPAGIGPRE